MARGMGTESARQAQPVPAGAREQALWTLHNLARGRGICNIALAAQFPDGLSIPLLHRALTHLLDRHAALRAVYDTANARLRRRTLPTGTQWPLEVLPTGEENLDDLFGDLAGVPFDLEQGPLVRGYLATLPDGAGALCLVFHHVVADFTSISELMPELARLYDALTDGRDPAEALPPAGAAHLESAPSETDAAYWRKELDGADPALFRMAAARPAPERPSFAAGRVELTLTASAHAAVAELAAGMRTSRNSVMLAAFALLLARHGAGPDLVVGVPVNGPSQGIEGRVGFHAATLPLRMWIDEAQDGTALIRHVRGAFLRGLEHVTSFESLRSAQTVADWRAPLVRHLFIYRPMDVHGIEMAGQRLTATEVHNGYSQYDLQLLVHRWPEHTHVVAVYSSEAHDHAEIVDLLDRYEALLCALRDAPDRRLRDLDAASPADREAERALVGTACAWPEQHCLDLILAQATRTPNAPAVRDAGASTSYAALLRAAEAVHDELTARGVRPQELVGVYARRGAALAAAVLGVWAAGAAFMPLDPGLPKERLAGQLDHAGVRTILADTQPPELWSRSRTVVPLPTHPAEQEQEPEQRETASPGRPRSPLAVPADSGPDDLAYVVYTSGSTGSPKGVEVTHRGIHNQIRSFADRLALGPADRMLWLTGFSFDPSILELLLPLATGGAVIAAPDDARIDARLLLEVVEREAVTVLQATPTIWRAVAEPARGRLTGVRLLTGGEPLTSQLAEKLLAIGGRLYNLYGPTETTIWSTVAQISEAARIGIGVPIHNARIRILLPSGTPAPPGVPGEMQVHGVGVGRGYRQAARQPASGFDTDEAGARCYRTGDLARLRDGALEFLGRRDRQVKIRGHRIELGEVEAVLEQLPLVERAAVLALLHGESLRLVAVVAGRADQAHPNAGESAEAVATVVERLRVHAATHLPAAAVPSRFVVLDRLPLTSTDKVDYGSLAASDAVAARNGEPAETPRDPRLRALVELWRRALEDEYLGADSDFFLNGGHSLLAVQMAQEANAVLGLRLTFAEIFAHPTPRKLADAVAREQA